MSDGPEMNELLSSSTVVCVDGLVKGYGVSILMVADVLPVMPVTMTLGFYVV